MLDVSSFPCTLPGLPTCTHHIQLGKLLLGEDLVGAAVLTRAETLRHEGSGGGITFQPLDGCGYGTRTGRNPGVADSMAGAGPAPRYPRQRQMLVLAEDRHACTHRHAPPCTNPLASTAMHSPISICHHARTHRQHSMASILLMHSPISIHPPACTRWQASC